MVYFFFFLNFFFCLLNIIKYWFLKTKNFFVFFLKNFFFGLKKELGFIDEISLVFEMIFFYIIVYSVLYFILYQAFSGIVYERVFNNLIGNLFLDFYIFEILIFLTIYSFDTITWAHFDFDQNELVSSFKLNSIAFRLFFKNYRSWRFLKFLWANEVIHLILPSTTALVALSFEELNKFTFDDFAENFLILNRNFFFYKFKYYQKNIFFCSDHLQFQKLCCLNNIFFNQFFFIRN